MYGKEYENTKGGGGGKTVLKLSGNMVVIDINKDEKEKKMDKQLTEKQIEFFSKMKRESHVSSITDSLHLKPYYGVSFTEGGIQRVSSDIGYLQALIEYNIEGGEELAIKWHNAITRYVLDTTNVNDFHTKGSYTKYPKRLVVYGDDGSGFGCYSFSIFYHVENIENVAKYQTFPIWSEYEKEPFQFSFNGGMIYHKSSNEFGYHS